MKPRKTDNDQTTSGRAKQADEQASPGERRGFTYCGPPHD